MDTKAYLSQIERLDRMIQNKLSEIYQLKQMAISISNVPKDVKVQASMQQDKLGETVAKLVDMERETDALVDVYIDKRNHIIRQIEGMDNVDYYHILFGVYVARKSLFAISKEIYFSEKHTKRKFEKAMDEFERMYGEEYLDI